MCQVSESVLRRVNIKELLNRIHLLFLLRLPKTLKRDRKLKSLENLKEKLNLLSRLIDVGRLTKGKHRKIIGWLHVLHVLSLKSLFFKSIISMILGGSLLYVCYWTALKVYKYIHRSISLVFLYCIPYILYRCFTVGPKYIMILYLSILVIKKYYFLFSLERLTAIVRCFGFLNC